MIAFRTKTIKLDNAEEKLALNIAGHTLRVIAVSSPAVVVTATIDETDAPEFQLVGGFGWQHGAFRRVYLTWAAQAGESITLLYGGSPADARKELFQAFSSDNRSNVQITNPDPVEVDIASQSGGNVAVDLVAQSGGNVNVNLNAQASALEVVAKANVLGSRGTPVTNQRGESSGTWSDVYTVPASTVFTIGQAWVQSDVTGGGALRIIDGSSTLVETFGVGKGETVYPAWEGMELPAGYKVQLKRQGASGAASGALSGWENSA